MKKFFIAFILVILICFSVSAAEDNRYETICTSKLTKARIIDIANAGYTNRVIIWELVFEDGSIVAISGEKYFKIGTTYKVMIEKGSGILFTVEVPKGKIIKEIK